MGIIVGILSVLGGYILIKYGIMAVVAGTMLILGAVGLAKKGSK